MVQDACGVLDWYALRVKSNREWMVQRALQLREVPEYLPLHTVRIQWSDRVTTATRPLFGGYVFARLPLGETASVLDLPGVVHLLPSSLEPAIIPVAEIELIERLIASKRQLRPVDHVCGEIVTVQSGALKGISGVVVRANTSNMARLVVSIEMMGRAIAVELDTESLAACQ